MQVPVYLDWNATAPLRPEAKAVLLAALELVGNPSSVHGPGRAARRVVEQARAQVAELAGVEPAWVLFTSGGTEANNWALRPGLRPLTLVGATEHASVLEAAPAALRVPVGSDGVIDLAALDRLLTGPALLSLQLANNETGVIQPVAEAAALMHARGGQLHVDAVQAAGRLPLDRVSLGADLLSLSAHKIGGPKGVGALIADPALDLPPLLRGGGQEARRRAGTENVAAIAGFGAAAEAAQAGLAGMAELAARRDRLEAQLRQAGGQVIADGARRLANTSCVARPGLSAQTQLMALDLAGFAVSAGAACSSGKVGPSPVLQAMGLGEAVATSAIRISIGWTTTDAELDRFAASYAALKGAAIAT
jgi:cysteine desulfurase